MAEKLRLLRAGSCRSASSRHDGAVRQRLDQLVESSAIGALPAFLARSSRAG
jgi:hypothetical protein